MQFELTILGSSGAVPAYGRHCTAHLLRLEKSAVLIDCGEGTQLQLQRAGEGTGRIGLILISHLHGDHYFGLPGLLTSMMLNGRVSPLHIISPPGLRDQLSALINFDRWPPPFPLTFEEVITTELQPLYSNDEFEVLGFPLQHRLRTNGYRISEPARSANIRKEAIKAYDIPYQAIPGIKNGDNFKLPTGEVVRNELLVVPAAPPRSYAFCSDTRYFPELANFVRAVDLLYHEATFLHESRQRAIETEHSTALEAAMTARDAGAKELILGHFSARYVDVQPHENEARTIFPRTYAARDLMRFVVPYRGREK